MDVRMLGGGRPFTLEVLNAKCQHPGRADFAAMQEALNGSGVGVELRKLQPITRATVQLIKVPFFCKHPTSLNTHEDGRRHAW